MTYGFSGISGFAELVKIEKELVSDNPPQVERLERIEMLFNDWNEQAVIPEIELAGALQDKKFMGELNEKQTKATKTILNCATELSELISDIFDSYKLDLEKIEFNEHEINLMELMDSVKDTAEKLIGEHKIIVENTTNENISVQ